MPELFTLKEMLRDCEFFAKIGIPICDKCELDVLFHFDTASFQLRFRG